MSKKDWTEALSRLDDKALRTWAKWENINLSGIPTHADRAEHLAGFFSMGYEFKQIVHGGKDK